MTEKFGWSGHTPELNKGPRKLRNKIRSDSMEHACQGKGYQQRSETVGSSTRRLDYKLLFYLNIHLNTSGWARSRGPWPLPLFYLRNILDYKCSNLNWYSHSLINCSVHFFVKLFDFLWEQAKAKAIDTDTHKGNTLKWIDATLSEAVDAYHSLCTAGKWHVRNKSNGHFNIACWNCKKDGCSVNKCP